ncbi:MAG: radical SAM protein [Thermotogae bacterium]|nr:radical SAM protein [Thermotogota bacterium]
MRNIKIYESLVKSILSRSKIPGIDYSLNPYIGCSFACKYCYASFVKRFYKHPENFGEFVEVKMNAPEILEKEFPRKKPGKIVMSLICDPYQPVEKKYKITRKCLEVFLKLENISSRFQLSILTKSPLVVRDIDILKELKNVKVGFSISTDSERLRKIFEPFSPTIESRIRALRFLKENGIRTYVFVAPVLPMNVENLMKKLNGSTDEINVDCMNYIWKTRNLYKKYKMEFAMKREYCEKIRKQIEFFFHQRPN